VTAAKTWPFLCCWLFCSLTALGGEVIPPSPAHYFNDYAHVVPEATVGQLNGKLEDFERSTGNQIVVAIYPKMQSDSSIDDYAVRVFRSWKVGQKDKNNGAVLFVFVQDRQMFLEVGYGLEGVLPDALCKQITEFEIKPHFKTGDYAGGLTAGVNAILAATRHEYKGNGTTVAAVHSQGAQNGKYGVLIVVIFFLVLKLLFSLAARTSGGASRPRGWLYSSGGWGGYSGGGWLGGGGSSGGGGGFSGGGFMGGGGSSGGGGAGSSW
jgi:uncharacterized protein